MTKVKFLKKIKKGTLSKQLEIPEKKNIPIKLLRKIKNTNAGEKIKNPTKSGKKVIRVTRLMKKRANLAITLKRFKRR